MKKLLLTLAAVFLLAACIPQIGTSDTASIEARRVSETVTASLTLTQPATQVAVIFRGDTFDKRFTERRLETGIHFFEVQTAEPVSCSASGWVGGRYFLIFC